MKAGNHSRNHNRMAPYWAALFILLCLAGLSTSWIDFGTFWRGYMLDIAGPAWTYILFRRLYTSYSSNWWTRFFSPTTTFFILIMASFGIETLQYYEVYPSTFDSLDFVAYTSLLLPLYVLDLKLNTKTTTE